MNNQPPQNFLGNTGIGGYRPEPTPIAQPKEAAVVMPSKQAELYVLTKRALRLYEAQIARVGVEAFAMMAYGPHVNTSAEQVAIERVARRMPEVISAANMEDVQYLLKHLLAGELFEAHRYLVNVVWERVLRAVNSPAFGKIRSINDRPFIPAPAAPRPPAASREYATPVPCGMANTQAVLSVSGLNMCTLSKPLMRATNLAGGDFVNVVAPRLPNGKWYLDTRPKPGAGTQLPKQGRALFRVPPMVRRHFMAKQLLHFVLGDEVADHPGYYELRRISAVV